MTTDIHDARARRRIVDSFSALGWDAVVPIGPGVNDIGNMIYVCDAATGFVAIAGVTRQGRAALQSRLTTASVSRQDIFDAFGTLIDDCARRNHTLTREERRGLVLLSTLYMLETQTYAIAATQGMPDCSFLIVRYPDARDGTNLLRPAALARSQCAYTPAVIESHVNAILERDRRAHPERFASAQVLRFAPRTPVPLSE